MPTAAAAARNKTEGKVGKKPDLWGPMGLLVADGV
jgi:hypothetical protein